MTDAEISCRLARAIGWPKAMMQKDRAYVSDGNGLWLFFDYRVWTIIGPIATRYERFPEARAGARCGTEWECVGISTYILYVADTPQKAIALAVIGEGK